MAMFLLRYERAGQCREVVLSGHDLSDAAERALEFLGHNRFSVVPYAGQDTTDEVKEVQCEEVPWA